MHHPILVVCGYRDGLDQECGRRYYFPYVRQGDSYRLQLVLDFSICPACQNPRNPEKFAQYKNSRKCKKCNVPHELQKIYQKGMCAACYLQEYRKQRKMQDIIQKVKVTDIIKA